MQGYNVLSVSPDTQSADGYDKCLTRLLSGLLERPDHKEGLVTDMLLLMKSASEVCIDMIVTKASLLKLSAYQTSQ